jgi:23S rRNA (uridine2552-2'-O)-methyltransferase
MSEPPKKSGSRTPTQKVKTAKRRKASSNRWLERHINDPFVHQAQKDGYRSRAVYKLSEIDDKYKILKKGLSVVDLGSAPGGWSQYALEKKCAPVIAIDLLPMDLLPDCHFLQMDFMSEDAYAHLMSLCQEGIDIVLSDMAPNTTGHKTTDHLRIVGLVEAAYDFAVSVLAHNGTFIAKVFQGGTEHELLKRAKQDFQKTIHVKPKASRAESAEIYLVAMGFRGNRCKEKYKDNGN